MYVLVAQLDRAIERSPPKRTNYGSLKEAAWDNFVKFKI